MRKILTILGVTAATLIVGSGAASAAAPGGEFIFKGNSSSQGNSVGVQSSQIIQNGQFVSGHNTAGIDQTTTPGSRADLVHAALNGRAAASPTSEAIGQAYDYLRVMPFSKAGLVDQLSSPYGSDFARPVAVYAVNHIRVNWNAQAVRQAKSYLKVMHFSCSGLISQLESRYGSQFTHAQAVYGANQTTAC